MKVLHVITKLELGGAQENTLYTVAHLDRDRFTPLLVTHPDGLLVADALADGRFETALIHTLRREVRPLSDFRALVSLARLMGREMKASGGEGIIVHTHSSKAGIVGRAAARMAGVPIVIHSIHGFGFHDYQSRPVRSLYVRLEKMASAWTTHYIAVSRANIDTGLSLGLFTPEKVTLIRSGIEIARFNGEGIDVAAGREALGLRPGNPVVGMVSCFKPQKNPLDFVRLASPRGCPVAGDPIRSRRRRSLSTEDRGGGET